MISAVLGAFAFLLTACLFCHVADRLFSRRALSAWADRLSARRALVQAAPDLDDILRELDREFPAALAVGHADGCGGCLTCTPVEVRSKDLAYPPVEERGRLVYWPRHKTIPEIGARYLAQNGRYVEIILVSGYKVRVIEVPPVKPYAEVLQERIAGQMASLVRPLPPPDLDVKI